MLKKGGNLIGQAGWRRRFYGRLAVLCSCLLAVGRATSQPLQLEVLHAFYPRGLDGDYPGAALTLGNDGNFYGTTFAGGVANAGTVFRLTAAGAFSSLHWFSADNSPNGLALGSDGNFYGTTSGSPPPSTGNPFSFGTVFRIMTNGNATTLGNFTTLHYFFAVGDNGYWPFAGLTLARDGSFYGTTSLGGTADQGTVFRVTTNGVFTTLVSFTGPNGAAPTGRLVQGPDGNLYGTTQGGGINDWGTVFKMTTNGVLTTIHYFTNGDDSSLPYAGLTLGPNGRFYGTTWGQRVNGTLFQVTTNGVLTTLYTFPTGAGGTVPTAELTLASDGNLYGTTSAWAGDGWGTVFRLTPNGVFSSLYSFTDGDDGAHPNGLVQGNDGNLYGTTQTGGPGGHGTIFRLVLPRITTVTHLPDGNIALIATGPSNQACTIWTSPDPSLPSISWALLATGLFDSQGNYSYTDSEAPRHSSRFYLLSLP